jgi:hypothetical protein
MPPQYLLKGRFKDFELVVLFLLSLVSFTRPNLFNHTNIKIFVIQIGLHAKPTRNVVFFNKNLNYFQCSQRIFKGKAHHDCIFKPTSNKICTLYWTVYRLLIFSSLTETFKNLTNPSESIEFYTTFSVVFRCGIKICLHSFNL